MTVQLKTVLRFSENGRFSMTMTIPRLLAVLAAALTLLACQDANKLKIRRTRDSQELNTYRVKSLTGIRDGEKLGCTLVIADNDDSLTLLLKFQVGVPTKLESGTYMWKRKDTPEPLEGSVKADAVTFQGGQDSPASLGGTFELVGKDVDISLYQVRVPATRMDKP